ncbi:MAG: DinB family protein [Chitinophagaceae bacterium]|nr:DinB family protein [Chitinophagaceae bacterium]
MKKLLLFLPIALMLSFSVSDSTLTKKERKFAKDHLKETKKDLVKTVEGLSQAQLSFKVDSSRWSVEDCVKHIAMAEMGLWKAVQDGLSQPPNPEKRAEIKMTDEQMVKGIQDRSSKFQAPETLQPKNTPFKSTAEALSSFKESRTKLISYIDDTQEDLRNHVINFPVGMMDAYQMVLLISAHSNRHTQQIKEVMADPNFPKQ